MRSVNDHPADGPEVLPVIHGLIEEIIWKHFGWMPASVIDFGCGSGHWLGWFKPYETRCVGIDSSHIRPIFLVHGYGAFVEKDLRDPYYHAYKVSDRNFDLALCLETAEHLEPEYADTLIDTICRHSDTVLFSAATPGQGGWKHLNEQPHEYWIEKFAARGYECDTSVRDVLPDDAPPWYKKNMMVFRRK